MFRWLATLAIALLIVLDLALPGLPMARRGAEAAARNELSPTAGQLGGTLPDLALVDLEGQPLDLADFRGHPMIVTFERSVDW